MAAAVMTAPISSGHDIYTSSYIKNGPEIYIYEEGVDYSEYFCEELIAYFP
jgi:hypothetical protein